MQPVILDGKKIAAEINQELEIEVKQYREDGRVPNLSVVIVGEDSASKIYVRNKQKACEAVGILSTVYQLPAHASQKELLELLQTLNHSQNVHGILVQLPLPAHIDSYQVIQAIDPQKDIDGFHPMNAGMFFLGIGGFPSCTPSGILELLKRYQIQIEGKHCVVIGRSNHVGKPMSILFLQENGTVSMCHSHTKNLDEICLQADILVCATGSKNTVTADMIKPGAVVVDVGMNRDETGKLLGDVDFAGCLEKVSAITPVPGGVGPMTIAMLLKNCMRAAKLQWEKS